MTSVILLSLDGLARGRRRSPARESRAASARRVAGGVTAGRAAVAERLNGVRAFAAARAHLRDADAPDVIAQVVGQRDGVAHRLLQFLRRSRSAAAARPCTAANCGVSMAMRQRRLEAARLRIAREVGRHARARDHLVRTADPVGDPVVAQADLARASGSARATACRRRSARADCPDSTGVIGVALRAAQHR